MNTLSNTDPICAGCAIDQSCELQQICQLLEYRLVVKLSKKTRAVRLYGKEDFRLEEFEHPPISADEILVKIV